MILYDRFEGGKLFAVTFSYDDGCPQDKRLAQLFDKYGVKCTFNLFSGSLEKNEDGGAWVNDYFKNHEIAIHAYHHPHLEMMSVGAQYEELISDRKYIEKLTGRIVRGMAFPFGTWNDTTLLAMKTAGIEYSRTTVATGSFTLPNSFPTWNPTCHHSECERHVKQFIYNIEKARWRSGALLYIWGHAYEFDHENVRVDWDKMEQIVSELSEHKDDIWFATNIEILDYVNAKNSLIHSADGHKIYNPSRIDIWVTKDGEPLCIKAGETVEI